MAGAVSAVGGLAAPAGLGGAASSRPGVGTPEVVSVTLANLSASVLAAAGGVRSHRRGRAGRDNDVVAAVQVPYQSRHRHRRPVARPVSCAGARNPSVHCPPRLARGAQAARRPGPQPALVLARRHPGALPLGRSEGLGQLRWRPDPAAGRRVGRAAAGALGGQEVRQEPAGDPGRPDRLPHRRPLVPVLRGGEPRRTQGHRLLLPGVRHHRGAAAVLRRSGHPGR